MTIEMISVLYIISVTESDLEIADLSVVTPAKVGGDLRLQCVGVNAPSSPINIEWFKNQQKLSESSDVVISEAFGRINDTSIKTSLLWQQNTQVSHSGIYTCVVATKIHCSVNSSIDYLVQSAGQ